ncbi:S-layer homology domain-containing protein [Bacillus horti]|uniref:SLH domain-containing protein n=1 Tax=Caldalkalibacillus horti TaxID=77523 RepID=A0ABT9W164_9BACI|nr:S-layer homology domain-containing protein [Bacillus horti]MDQ0166977.1 hypothetical protein [Bacillus horti]
MNKIITAISTALITLSMLSPSALAMEKVEIEETSSNDGTLIVGKDTNFIDVSSSHWAYSVIQSAVKKGYVEGYADSTFKPDRSVSRAEFITMAVRALGIEAPEQNKVWYDGFIKAATDAGIYENQFTEAQYSKAIPREQMARLAVKAAGIKLYKRTEFNDAGYMYLATKNGLVNGMGNGRVAPEGLTTRAQAISVIERILAIKNGQQLTPADQLTQENAEFAWHHTNMYTVMGDYLDVENPRRGLSPGPHKLETKDGLYSGEMHKLIVVDLEDNKAIQRYNVDLENWRWNAADKANYSIKDYRNSFLFILESSTVSVDRTKYGDFGYLPYNVFTSYEDNTFQEYVDGQLNSPSHVLDKRDIKKEFSPTVPTIRRPIFIVSKEYMSDYLWIEFYTPAIPGVGQYQREMILHINLR